VHQALLRGLRLKSTDVFPMGASQNAQTETGTWNLHILAGRSTCNQQACATTSKSQQLHQVRHEEGTVRGFVSTGQHNENAQATLAIH